MVHGSDQPSVDDSILPIPNDMFTSEAFKQYSGDDYCEGPADDAASAAVSEVALDQNHLEKNFEYDGSTFRIGL